MIGQTITRRWLAALVLPVLLLAVVLTPARATASDDAARARVVIDWNQALLTALTLANTPPPPAMRAGAIVATSVFDAVDGITHRYTPYHVTTADAPRGASAAAAAAGAAHEALVALFPSQQTSFDTLLTSTLAWLSDDHNAAAIERGVTWGASVADSILTLRANDGLTATPPPYVISPVIGRWQPTPPAFSPTPAFRQFATMTPWALTSPAQFLPAPPPRLTSRQYARDLNEVESLGSLTSTTRSAFDTQTAPFWQSATPVVIWNQVTDTLITGHHLGLTDAARLLALENMAMADAVIAVWNAKNYYDTWRPITAIQNAALDGNPRTDVDPTFQPLLVTPAFQEYPAGHPGVSQAAAAVLADRFGNCTRFTLGSPGMPGVTRTFRSFSASVAQVIDARVFGGIHFRFAGNTAAAMGRSVAAYVEATQLRRLR
jgi:PAP2 superfamily